MKKFLALMMILPLSISANSPYFYNKDESKTLMCNGISSSIRLTVNQMGCNENIIAEIDFAARTIVCEDLNGNILFCDSIPINAKAFSSIDSKAFETPNVSPYTFCMGDPINLIDPSGCSPIYSTTGEFLGTDDEGLQGESYIMEASNFNQNMSPEDAKKHALNPNLFSEVVVDRIMKHFNKLPDRPDYDGYLTMEEANWWFKNGNGMPLFVDLSKIDLSGIVSFGDNYIGQKKTFNLLTGSSRNLNDGLVYGNITLIRNSNNTVRAYADKYDFDMKSWANPSNWIRNTETIIGRKVAGNGTAYLIYFHGSAPIKPIFPWVK